MQKAERRYPWQPWNAGTTLTAATNWYLPKGILISENTYQYQTPGREGEEGARIRNDLQEGKNWSTMISKQSYNAKQH